MKLYYRVGEIVVDYCEYCNNSGCSYCYESEDFEFPEGEVSEEEIAAIIAFAPNEKKAVTLDRRGCTHYGEKKRKRLWHFDNAECFLFTLP